MHTKMGVSSEVGVYTSARLSWCP